jgi:exodeoxyribonuclease III
MRLPVVLDWLAANQPDVLAIQETKVEDALFPALMFEQAGWQVVYNGRRALNGVAIVSREKPAEVSCGFGDPGWTEDARLIAARIGPLTVLNTYVPNGTAVGSDKFTYKLTWLRRFGRYVAERFKPEDAVIWLGDINVAPAHVDVFDPERMAGKIGHHPEEIAALANVLSWGWVDLYRHLNGDKREYTFWDYRLPKSFERDLGWRIDHIYAPPALAAKCRSCEIDRAPRARDKPSDHTFVTAVLDL